MAARAGYNQTGKRNFRSVPCSDRLYSVSYIYTVIPSIILFFNIPVTIHSPDKVTRQCPQTTTFWRERKAEADSNRGPSAYQPNVLPVGQTGSQGKRRERNANKTVISKRGGSKFLGHSIRSFRSQNSYQSYVHQLPTALWWQRTRLGFASHPCWSSKWRSLTLPSWRTESRSLCQTQSLLTENSLYSAKHERGLITIPVRKHNYYIIWPFAERLILSPRRFTVIITDSSTAPGLRLKALNIHHAHNVYRDRQCYPQFKKTTNA